MCAVLKLATLAPSRTSTKQNPKQSRQHPSTPHTTATPALLPNHTVPLCLEPPPPSHEPNTQTREQATTVLIAATTAVSAHKAAPC